MLEKTMRLLAEHGDFEEREDYSGRGMFGRTTCAVVAASYGDILVATAYAADGLDEEELEEFTEDLRNARFDDMGLGIVCY